MLQTEDFRQPLYLIYRPKVKENTVQAEASKMPDSVVMYSVSRLVETKYAIISRLFRRFEDQSNVAGSFARQNLGNSAEYFCKGPSTACGAIVLGTHSDLRSKSRQVAFLEEDRPVGVRNLSAMGRTCEKG